MGSSEILYESIWGCISIEEFTIKLLPAGSDAGKTSAIKARRV
jgi:hypothetical protein